MWTKKYTYIHNIVIIIIIIIIKQFDETIDHITSAYPILTKEQYTKRHDRVCAQLHFNILVCKEAEVKLDKKHWYEHEPKSVETSQGSKVTILWNQQVQTDRTIPNNKPDIIIRDHEKGTCVNRRCNFRRQKCD